MSRSFEELDRATRQDVKMVNAFPQELTFESRREQLESAESCDGEILVEIM